MNYYRVFVNAKPNDSIFIATLVLENHSLIIVITHQISIFVTRYLNTLITPKNNAVAFLT